MKRLLRSKAVQAALGWLVAVYVRLLMRTLRWQVENRAPVDRAMAAQEGLIALLWHGRIAQALATRALLGTKPRRVMISLSADGEFIAKASAHLRIPPIRGSAGGAARTAAKGGAGAFREALSFLADGGVVVLTPDGPRGPAEVLPPGSARLARAAGCPVFLMSLAARPAISLRSWDRAQIPLPFARAGVVLEGPLQAPLGAGPAALEAVRLDWQMRLRAGQDRAEALLAGRGR